MFNISDLLSQYHYMSECVLLKFSFQKFQTELDLMFNYIWEENGQIRKDLEKEKVVTLRFHIVQELHMLNTLNLSNISQYNQMNWGINEISLIKLEDDTEILKPYRDLGMEFHHVAILWEMSRRIDIVFSRLEIIED